MQRKRARAAEPIARYSSTLGATEQRHPALVKTAFLMRSAITAGRRASRSSALGFRKVTTRIRSRIGPGSGSSVVRCAKRRRDSDRDWSAVRDTDNGHSSRDRRPVVTAAAGRWHGDEVGQRKIDNLAGARKF